MNVGLVVRLIASTEKCGKYVNTKPIANGSDSHQVTKINIYRLNIYKTGFDDQEKGSSVQLNTFHGLEGVRRDRGSELEHVHFDERFCLEYDCSVFLISSPASN